MLTEHETVMAQMARLQGKIDACRKTLGSSASPTISTPIINHTTNISPSTSSSVSLLQNQQQLIANQSNQSSLSTGSKNLPLVTKTTWQLNQPLLHNRQPSSITTFRSLQSRGSTKLILNQPNRLPQSNTTSTSTSAPTTAATAHLVTTTTPTPPSINLIRSSPPLSLTCSSTTGLTTPTNPPSTIQTSIPSNCAVDPHTTQHSQQGFSSPSLTPSAPSLSVSFNSPSQNLLNQTLSPNSSAFTQTTSNFKKLDISSNSIQSSPSNPRSPAPSKASELVIDGVSFVRDTQGKKLVRKTEPLNLPQPEQAPSTFKASTSQATLAKATPMKASIGGMTYVRTKSGNLVELSALKKFQSQKIQEMKRARLLAAVNAMKSKYNKTSNYSTWDPKKISAQGHIKPNKFSRPPLIKKNEQCRYFAKTGACRNGLTCVYQHDPAQVAICPRFLRHKCSYSANSCPLSHKPNPHNMEHCSHFPRCNKPDCPYPHVKPTSAQICHDFADLGWCSKGAQCTERHVRECPEFSTKGTCSNPGCRLRHMINRNKTDNEDEEQDVDQPAGTIPSDDDGGGGLFFTDLTGSGPKGKRKAVQSNRIEDSPQRTFKGISHNSEVLPPVKRAKYDDMAENEDFVMFISSDEEENQESVELDDSEEENASSVDSEELDSVLLDEYPAKCNLDSSTSGVGWVKSSKPHNRSSLKPGDEIEEGEIFDDDYEDGDDALASSSKDFAQGLTLPMSDSAGDGCSSDDDEEEIARQLLGN